MGRRRLAVLVGIVLSGGSVLLLRSVAPNRYDSLAGAVEPSLSGLPQPVVLGGATLAVLTVWAAAMILLAKALYLVWRQLDDYVFWVWDRLLPESPILRFGFGVIVMLFLFIFGPLVVLQSTDFMQGEDDTVEEQLDANTTTPDNETGGNESASLADSSLERLDTGPDDSDEGYALLAGSSDKTYQGRIRPT